MDHQDDVENLPAPFGWYQMAVTEINSRKRHLRCMAEEEEQENEAP